jgi:hypothetical protein
MATVRSMNVTVGRKLTQNYCSQEIRLSVEIDLDQADDALVVARQSIRGLKREITQAIRPGAAGPAVLLPAEVSVSLNGRALPL